MKKSGIIDKIWNDYAITSNIKCEEMKVRFETFL